jgi:hypothetical protein
VQCFILGQYAVEVANGYQFSRKKETTDGSFFNLAVDDFSQNSCVPNRG